MKKIIVSKLISVIIISAFIFTGCGSISQPENEITKMQQENENQNQKYPQKIIMNMTAQKQYYDGELRIQFLGLEEYDEIKSDSYLDKPEKGKKYLLLYLLMSNGRTENFYFHPDYLSAKVDGKDIQYTVIQNNPHDYATAFKNYKAESTEGGFVAFQVEDNWEKLEMTYTGMEFENGNIIQMEYTKDDLQEPENARYVQ